ncbi:MAG: FkbM family methyltransferase, partial [Planctomycetota bacterium]
SEGPRSTVNVESFAGKDLPQEKIQIRRLEDVLREHDVEEVAFWKLDVEGHEPHALLGAGEYIAERRIQNIFFECHPDNLTRNREILTSHGYTLSRVTADGVRPFTENSISATRDLLARPASQ